MTTLHTRRSAREMSTDEVKVGQAPDIVVNDHDKIDREQIVVAVDSPLLDDDVKMIAFAEEPVTIRLERSNEKFAPMVADAWVNGKGAEVLINGKWIEMGWLPVGHVVTTKRKYVEVIARSKTDTVNTNVVKHEESEENIIQRYTSSKTPFTVVKDANPLGVEWLTKLLMEG